MLWRRLFLMMMVTTFVILSSAGCTGAHSDQHLPEQVVALQSVWKRDGWIYILDEQGSTPDRVWRKRLDGPAIEFALPSFPDCEAQEPRGLFNLPDQELGVLVRCGEGRLMLGAVAQAGSVRTLAVSEGRADAAVWNSLRGYGILGLRLHDCWGMSYVGSNGQQGWPAASKKALGAAGLDVPLPTDLSCENRGNIPAFALSPSSDRLYFVGSPDAAKVKSSSRRTTEGFLFALNISEGKLDRMEVAFASVGQIAIESSEKFIAVLTGQGGKPGVWIVDVGGRKACRVASGAYSTIAISPDGRFIAAVTVELEPRIELIEVSEPLCK